MLSPFTYGCLSHTIVFSSEFDDYSIVCNKLVVSGDFIKKSLFLCKANEKCF